MHRVLRTLIPAALALATLVLTSACGVKSAYDNADWLLMRWIDNRVSLTAEQELAVRDALASHLRWHCATELDAYSELLRSLSNDIAADRITTERLAEYEQRVAAFGRRILDRVRPSIVELLATLSDEQVAELMAGFEERNQELAEALGRSEAERREERIAAMRKGMRRLGARPTERQRQQLLAWVRGLEATAALELEERRSWQARFERALSLRHDRIAFEQAVGALLRPGSGRSAPLREREARNRSRTMAVLVDMHQAAPAAQNQRVSRRLGELARDFEELSCR